MRRSKPKTNEIVTRLVEVGVLRLVEDAGLSESMARTVIRQVVHEVCTEFGGGEFYMPKDLDFPRSKRDEEIWCKFNGANGWELAIEFGICERQIRYICTVMRKRAVALNQLDLPGIDATP